MVESNAGLDSRLVFSNDSEDRIGAGQGYVACWKVAERDCGEGRHRSGNDGDVRKQALAR